MNATTITTKRIVLVCTSSFIIGASMELFMIKTGFYDIVTRKESERQHERLIEQQRQSDRYNELRKKYNIKE